MQSEIFSVGIDIGTTTIQVIFSKFIIRNTAGLFNIPKVKITDKEIVYKSKIYFTPFINSDSIDFDSLKNIVKNEFSESGFSKENLNIGAIIITGEAARKENAEKVIHALSEFAGDFVVATAGPDLEAVFAGFGSGCAQLSKESSSKVLNFDIGGGTTNACFFINGDSCDTFALDIGGRLIKFDSIGHIIYISERLEELIEESSLNLCIGSKAQYKELKKLTDRLALMFLELCGFLKLQECTKKLFILHQSKKLKASYVTFSGGVSEFIYGVEEIDTIEKVLKFSDIGPLLGFSIREVFKEYDKKLLKSKERIRATVIGAGNYSMKVSGSTIIYDDNALPLKNIPIIKIFDKNYGTDKGNFNTAKSKIKLYEDTPVAISFTGPKSPSYEDILMMAEEIIKVFELSSYPIIVIVENDFAKALGQTIKNKIKFSRSVICIDKISAFSGDYIDIGKSISGIIPVVVKTLIFKN